jgi:hypothetical protein
MSHFIMFVLGVSVLLLGWYLGTINAKTQANQVYCLKCRAIMRRDRWIA